MKISTCVAAVTLVAALCAAGCGQDNGRHGNDNTGGPTATPVKTSTPVVTTSTPGVVATPTTETSGPTPTTGGTPVPTPTGGGTSKCESDHMTLTITSGAGSDLDTGWTGIAHNQPTLEQTKVTVNLDCVGNDCTVDGAALNGTAFGSPLPLAAGGVPACVINVFRAGVTGTYNCATGCGESSVQLTSSVILAQILEKPCPNCMGDATPNDGVKGGTCDSGKNKGGACDTGGISPVFGPTSNDCLPSASSVGELPIDITPLTTGTVTQTATVQCAQPRFGVNCYCPMQDRPNACTAPSPEGTCPDSGFCDDPTFGACSGEPARACDPGNGTGDCEDIQPGSGTCEAKSRPCFGTSISRTGQCGTQNGTLVGFFCIPATRAPAINTVSGLPGPGTVSLPVSSLRVPR
ncbi:MAG TPA: hypothetical protein VGK30_03925 [Candidatus Binatia bacterium]